MGGVRWLWVCAGWGGVVMVRSMSLTSGVKKHKLNQAIQHWYRAGSKLVYRHMNKTHDL